MLKTRSRILAGISSLLMVTLSACGDMADPEPVHQAPDAGANEPAHQEPDAGVNEPPPPPEPGPTARFADWTAEERELAIAIGGGDGATMAMFSLLIADLDSQFGECPQRVLADDAFTYSAGSGCVTERGVTWAGEASATNAPRVEQDQIVHDPSLPTRAEFRRFQLTDAQSSDFFDGTYVQTPTADGYTKEMDLTFGTTPAASMVGAFTCVTVEDHTQCTINEGARGEVAGKGTFLVRGQLQTFSDGFGGWLELQGQDVMRIEAAPDRPCSPITIDGVAAGELCGNASPEER